MNSVYLDAILSADIYNYCISLLDPFIIMQCPCLLLQHTSKRRLYHLSIATAAFVAAVATFVHIDYPFPHTFSLRVSLDLK